MKIEERDTGIKSEMAAAGLDTQRLDMTSVVSTYLSQRFPFLTYSMLALFLMLFSVGLRQFIVADIFLLAFILLLLLTMRLYDDLQNIRFDVDKPGRNYVNPLATRKVYIFFLICALVGVCIALVMRPAMGLILLAFFVSIHGIYILLVNRAHWRYFLPLIKYPFIAALVADNWTPVYLSLFFAFLTFDLIDDPTFPLPRWTSGIWSLAAFAFLLFSEPRAPLLMGSALTVAACCISLIENKYAAYAFLILLLTTRLSASYYEI